MFSWFLSDNGVSQCVTIIFYPLDIMIVVPEKLFETGT